MDGLALWQIYNGPGKSVFQLRLGCQLELCILDFKFSLDHYGKEL